MSEYFAMGGHAAFIWPSYGVAALLLAALFLLSARRLHAAERALEDSDANPDSFRSDGEP
jgi:heme exporter protein D